MKAEIFAINSRCFDKESNSGNLSRRSSEDFKAFSTALRYSLSKSIFIFLHFLPFFEMVVHLNYKERRKKEQHKHRKERRKSMGKTKAKCVSVKLEVECVGIVTGDMTKRLDELSEETRRKAKEIIEGKAQDGDEDAAIVKEWLDGSSPEREIRLQEKVYAILKNSKLTLEEIEIAERVMNLAAEKIKEEERQKEAEADARVDEWRDWYERHCENLRFEEKEPPKTSKVRRVWF